MSKFPKFFTYLLTRLKFIQKVTAAKRKKIPTGSALYGYLQLLFLKTQIIKFISYLRANRYRKKTELRKYKQ